MNKLTLNNKKGPKHFRRLHVAGDLISAYVRLSEDDKVYLERFLALSAYDDAGMNHYAPHSKHHRVEAEHSLCDRMSTPVRDALFQWAKMVKRAKFWEFERGEAVREMLGVLIAQKNKNSLSESELHEAAEKAVEWTRWDTFNRAKARLRNSPEYKLCLEAIASRRIDLKEATKQLDALETRVSF